MESKKYLRLFASCIPVRGYLRSVIIDTQRGGVHFIPNDLFNILETELALSYEELINKYTDSKKELDEYFIFLLKSELAFYTHEPENFPLISNNWETPHQISNAIIDIADFSEYDFLTAITQIDELGVQALQIRIFSKKTIEWIAKFFQDITLLTNRIKTIELYLKHNELISQAHLEQEILNFNLLSYVVIHSSNKEEIKTDLATLIIYTREEICNESHCGIIDPSLFSTNLEHVIEAMHFNTCLNKKISIDSLGNIKNCPSMNNSFGNINDTVLNDVIRQSEFKEKWNIKKEMINICKDCEFRLICSDCRAYVENDYEKPVKCSYNPYSATWED